jgi:hypothetical protein
MVFYIRVCSGRQVKTEKGRSRRLRLSAGSASFLAFSPGFFGPFSFDFLLAFPALQGNLQGEADSRPGIKVLRLAMGTGIEGTHKEMPKMPYAENRRAHSA